MSYYTALAASTAWLTGVAELKFELIPWKNVSMLHAFALMVVMSRNKLCPSELPLLCPWMF